jgi:hypothetical protein
MCHDTQAIDTMHSGEEPKGEHHMGELDDLAEAAQTASSVTRRTTTGRRSTGGVGGSGGGWMLLHGQQESGPYDDHELRTLWRSGALDADAKVWREGMSDWVPIDSE